MNLKKQTFLITPPGRSTANQNTPNMKGIKQKRSREKGRGRERRDEERKRIEERNRVKTKGREWKKTK